jgi:uncharacterized repeat protein (TIGR01451 family)
MSAIETQRRTVLENYGNLPLTFVENAGQARSDIRYLLNMPGYGISFTPEEAMYIFIGNAQNEQKGLALSLQFLHANTSVDIEGRQQQLGKVNYMIGNDPEKWRTSLSTYREVAYRELWPGVDLIFHGEGGKLKYDVVVQPGARIEDIHLAYQGADRLSLDEKGNLLIHTPFGILTEEHPVSYQEIEGKKVPVESRFVLKENEQEACVYGFEVGDDYHADYALVIDPTLLYSSYLGGSGTETGFAIAVDGAGNAFVTGQTVSANFSLTPGAFQTMLAGSSDAFVTKVNPEGTALVYSTFLGGTSLDLGMGIAVDGAGLAYVTGQTISSNFPVTPGAFQTTIGGNRDGFVTKLNFDGSGLVYSTYLGGSSVDNGNAIAVDGSGIAYVTGSTSSSNFPVTSGVFQSTLAGSSDVFVTKLNAAGSALVYSTYIGGSSIDEGLAITIDGSGNAYVTGDTFSANFPTTPGAFQITLHGTQDAFIFKLNATATALVYSTYLGGSGNDDGEGIAIDGSGKAYVTGKTNSTDFPVTAGSFQTTYGGGSFDAYVTKLNADGTQLVYSTFLGGSGADSGVGIGFHAGIAYVTGGTGSDNFPITPDAIQPIPAGGGDAFLTELSPDGSSLVFSTFLGGSSSDAAFSIAVDGSGSAYLIGQTFSTNFPVTPGAFQTALAGGGDAFVTKIGATAEVSLLKFSDRFEVRPGETVTFFIEVTNPSIVTLTNVKIEDPLLGFFTVIPELPAFAVQIFEVVFTVPPGTPPGFITNVVTVTSDQIPEPQTAKSDIFVTETPSLLATKTVNPPAAAPGETVVFTITLQNIGNVDLINVRITDPLIGLDETLGDIPVGASVTIDWPFVIPADALAGVTIANTVIITANNLPEPETVGTVVDVLAVPRVTLTKTADRTVVPPGETVTFTITLSNSGNTALTNIAVTDDLTGFSTVIPILAIGQTELLQVPFLVPLETPPQTFINTVTAVSNETAPESASAEFTVSVRPLLGISKVPASATVTPGETFNYTVTLSNIGNVPQTAIHVTDPLLGFDQTIATLTVGETIELVIPFTVPQGTPIGSDIVNLLTVSSAEAGTQQVESTVTVAGAGLALSKQPDRTFAAPGETVTFTLTVVNLLATAQTNVVLSDPLLGISETVAVLPANGTITRTATFTMPVGAANGSVITNVFTASSDQTPLQETTAEVVVRSVPGAETTLAVQKLPDRNEAAPGDTVHYTVQVTNTGSNPATNVVVQDSLTGTVTTISVIAPGETAVVTFSFTLPVTAVNGTVFANRVTVTWPEQPPGSLPVQSEARVTVAEPAGLPELAVQVTPPTANPGETVTKTITITNVSNQTLTNVRVTDSLIGFSTVIPSLAPGEQRVFTLPFTIPAGTIGETVFLNTVTIFSDQTPPQQETVSILTASLPDAELTETVDRPQGRPGETVFFTIQVRNTGNVALINGILTAPLMGIQLHLTRFEIGAVETLRVPFVLPNVKQTTILTSPVTFSSDNGPTRLASASVTVIVEQVGPPPTGSPTLPLTPPLQPKPLPDAELTETVDRPEGRPGETVTFTIQVINTGNVTLLNGKLIAPLLGIQQQLDRLDPGANETLRVPFVLPDVKENTTITSPVTFTSDNGPTRRASASVLVIAEEEE